MDLESTPPWELRRPDLLLQELAALHPFDRPHALLARVDGPYARQRLTAATVLWEEPPEAEDDLRRATEEALGRLECGWSDLPFADQPLVVAVVVRPGPSWWSPDEADVAYGLRYGSNLSSVRQGGIVTVTARGWLEQADELCGARPRARWDRSVPAALAAVDEAQAVVRDHAARLVAPRDGECLYHYLLRMLDEHGCAGHRFTARWAEGRRVRGRPVLQWAVETGGCCCDCEVLLNSLGRRSTRRVGLLCPEARRELSAQDGRRYR